MTAEFCGAQHSFIGVYSLVLPTSPNCPACLLWKHPMYPSCLVQIVKCIRTSVHSGGPMRPCEEALKLYYISFLHALFVVLKGECEEEDSCWQQLLQGLIKSLLQFRYLDWLQKTPGWAWGSLGAKWWQHVMPLEINKQGSSNSSLRHLLLLIASTTMCMNCSFHIYLRLLC